MKFTLPLLTALMVTLSVPAMTDKVAADLDIARTWKPGTLKDDGKRSGSEKGFRK